jgi:transposase
LSVNGALTVSALQQRLGVYFSFATNNITGDDVFTFVQRLRQHLRRPLLIVWDRFSGHQKAERLLKWVYGRHIHVERLPAYAPDLNVVDHCWGHTKYSDLANFIPDNLDDLAREVATSLIAKHHRPSLIKSFFQHAGLEL